MLWQVGTKEKKCVYTRTHYEMPDDSPVAPGKTFYIDEMYRWGHCTVRSNTKPEQHPEDPYSYPFRLDEYEIEDQECDDGCSLFFEYEEDDEWTEEEKEYVQDLWDEDSWSAFDEHGIYCSDHSTEYVGPLEVTCIDDTPEEPKPAPSATWPF
jgi:hypothetical protein